VELCVPNKFADGFVTFGTLSAGSPEEIGNNLISLLVEAGALPGGVEMLSLDVNQELSTLTVDMNSAYGKAVSISEGTANEYLLIGTVANTLLNYFDARFITIKVDGEPLQSNFTSEDGSPANFFIDQRTYFTGPLTSAELKAMVASLPDPSAIDDLYRYFGGYWNSNKKEYLAFNTHCGKPYVDYGKWNSDYARGGPLTSAAAAGDLSVELVFQAQDQPGAEGSDGYPEEPVTILIDLASYRKNEKIKVGVTAAQSNGKPTTYTHVGMTFQEAMDAS